MAENENGNIRALSSSTEDLSEYTDADESISSAPTEFLAEFLSAVMMKDYKTALKYCHLILQYEPNNSTAKEFYPLIVTKLRIESTNSSGSSGADDNNLVYEIENKNSKDSDAASTDDDSDSESEDDDEDDEEEEPQGISSISGDRHSDGTTASYSSLEDDDAIEAHNLSNSNKYGNVDNADYGNGNAKIGVISPVLSAKKAWEVTAENEIKKKMEHVTLNMHTSSDSESPTEPVSQQLIEQLRNRVINCKNN
ncbi:probable ATP-dependent RNA helicase ddx52 [Chrysoperla carnea]|uniref:probable ATP-dependent RNA helicase ddx52 n=1 Tax=Chrysoperla carnea TaxID=189513 RepID=UPI001D0968E7|nr:probable ATP-dependent RNA helicase ddx52 [Chrysoperla carnea]